MEGLSRRVGELELVIVVSEIVDVVGWMLEKNLNIISTLTLDKVTRLHRPTDLQLSSTSHQKSIKTHSQMPSICSWLFSFGHLIRRAGFLPFVHPKVGHSDFRDAGCRSK